MTDPEVKFGYAVTGHVHPDRILTNAGARPGEVLVLTKGLCPGVVVRAARLDRSTEGQLVAVGVAAVAVGRVENRDSGTGFVSLMQAKLGNRPRPIPVPALPGLAPGWYKWSFGWGRTAPAEAPRAR